MKLSQVAFDAADIMSEKGHCKHALTDLDGRVCFTGAVSAAMLGHPVWYEVARVPLMSEELRAEVMHSFAVLSETATEILVERGLPADGPVRFNNSANTTGEDVILLLKQVGERLACRSA